jgi:ribosome-associated heat shock protein Hsp15
MSADGVRIDKWLWAARLYKTRSLAAEAIDQGRVTLNGDPVKPSREPKPGDLLSLRQPGLQREFVVLGLSSIRGPAPAAQQLYRETEESVARRERAADLRRLGVEPALAQTEGRPTKRDRRQIEQAGERWRRWSASTDDAQDGDSGGS